MTSQAINDLPDPMTVPTAGFLPRVAAAIVDIFVLAPLGYAVYVFMTVYPSLAGLVGTWMLTFLYKPLTEALLGFTVGKWLLKLRVVDRGTNYNISLNQSFMRYLPWAVSSFVALFVQVRIFQSAGITEIEGFMEYNRYVQSFPLSENFFVGLASNFPIFSAVWLITDPWHRALHDRWAETFVIKQLPLPEGG